MQIASSVALVTGASSGIGQALALRLTRAGAHVFAHGRDPCGLRALSGVTPVLVDLAQPDGPVQLAEHVLSRAGRVDLLVNNAGTGWAGAFTNLPSARLDALLDVNLRAPLHLTRALLPGMLERGRGHLVFVGSIAGRLGVREEAVYAAAKAGLDVFAGSLRQELAASGIAVTVVVPGVVETAFFDRRGRAYVRRRPRPLSVDHVADAVFAAIERGLPELYLPGWLRLPVMVASVFPAGYRRLAGRFG